jgi:tetratricopeptide (TPR) repeat protein
MLETIREFAFTQLEQSGELERLAERHTQAFVALAQAAYPHLTRARRREWLERLEGDLDNLRAALSRLLQRREAGAAQRMVGALWRFWLMRAHLQEGRERAEEALKLSGSEPSECIAALSAAGSLAYWQTDAGAAIRRFEEAVAMARAVGDRRTLALTLYDYGFGVMIGGDRGRALALVEEGLTIARELGEPEVLGELLCALGTLQWRLGSPEAALPVLDEALEVLAGSDSVHLLAWARAMRGNVRLAGGDIEGAREDYRERSLLYDDSGDLGSESQQLIVLANLALAQGRLERALRLRGAAEAALEASQTRPLVVESLAERFAEAAGRVGRERAEELMAEGRLMPIEQAAAYAMEGLSR